MTKQKKKQLAKLTTFLLAFAPIAPAVWGSAILLGEPQLPKKMLKKDVIKN